MVPRLFWAVCSSHRVPPFSWKKQGSVQSTGRLPTAPPRTPSGPRLPAGGRPQWRCRCCPLPGRQTRRRAGPRFPARSGGGVVRAPVCGQNGLHLFRGAGKGVEAAVVHKGFKVFHQKGFLLLRVFRGGGPRPKRPPSCLRSLQRVERAMPSLPPPESGCPPWRGAPAGQSPGGSPPGGGINPKGWSFWPAVPSAPPGPGPSPRPGGESSPVPQPGGAPARWKAAYSCRARGIAPAAPTPGGWPEGAGARPLPAGNPLPGGESRGEIPAGRQPEGLAAQPLEELPRYFPGVIRQGGGDGEQQLVLPQGVAAVQQVDPRSPAKGETWPPGF